MVGVAKRHQGGTHFRLPWDFGIIGFGSTTTLGDEPISIGRDHLDIELVFNNSLMAWGTS